jgi:hypothetical protein
VSTEQTPEQARASAARAIERIAARRNDALATVSKETDRLRAAVLAGLAAGITTRRAAELGHVSLDTIARWSRQTKEDTTQ